MPRSDKSCYSEKPQHQALQAELNSEGRRDPEPEAEMRTKAATNKIAVKAVAEKKSRPGRPIHINNKTTKEPAKKGERKVKVSARPKATRAPLKAVKSVTATAPAGRKPAKAGKAAVTRKASTARKVASSRKVKTARPVVRRRKSVAAKKVAK